MSLLRNHVVLMFIYAVMTGVYFALYPTSNGEQMAPPADFDWFEYRPASASGIGAGKDEEE